MNVIDQAAPGVSWNDAAAFCEWLSRREGKPEPTEAEWEYVSRKGFGVKNTDSGVAEWVSDWHGLYPGKAQVDPVGPALGIARVVRGGGLDYKASKTDGGDGSGVQLA